MLHAAALAVLLAAAPATPAAPAPKELPLAAQVAREVLTPELWSETLAQLVPQAAGQIREMVTAEGGTVDAGLEAALRGIYDRAIPYEFVVDLQAGLLEKNFTPAELAEMRAFYRTPLGRKMRDRMPSVTADATAAAMQRLQGLSSEFQALEPLIHMPQRNGGAVPAVAK